MQFFALWLTQIYTNWDLFFYLKYKKIKDFDALGDVLKPGTVSAGSNNHIGNVSASAGQNLQQQQQPQPTNTGKVLTGDLESSLASLAENLTIDKSASAQVK